MANKLKTVKKVSGALTLPQHRQIRSMIKGFMESRAEKKVFISSIAPTVSLSTGNIVTVTQGLVQGDNIDNRTGNQIFLQEIQLRMQLALPAAGVQGSCRFVVFLDTLNNGSVPTTTDVLAASTVYSGYTLINLLKKRFHILLDHTQPLVAGGANQAWHKDYRLRVNKPVYFQGGNNVPGSNSKNAVFVLVLTDSLALQPSYSFDTSLRFYDF